MRWGEKNAGGHYALTGGLRCGYDMILVRVYLVFQATFKVKQL